MFACKYFISVVQLCVTMQNKVSALRRYKPSAFPVCVCFWKLHRWRLYRVGWVELSSSSLYQGQLYTRWHSAVFYLLLLLFQHYIYHLLNYLRPLGCSRQVIDLEENVYLVDSQILSENPSNIFALNCHYPCFEENIIEMLYKKELENCLCN